MAETETPPEPPQEIRCPGCGGRNVPNAPECDWCGRIFASPGRRLQVAGWQIASTALLLAMVGAIATLGVLNANRALPNPRTSATPSPTLPTVLPTAAVTPAIVLPTETALPESPAATPGATAAPASEPTATPPPRTEMRIAGTGGLGVVIRAEPGSESEAVGALREGATVILTGQEQTVAARLWRQVEAAEGGMQGWVLSDYLEGL